MIINNRYGFPLFLKEYNNVYFLNSDIYSDDRSVYYINHPIIQEKTNIEDIIDAMRIEKEDKRIRYFCTLKDKKAVLKQLDLMDYKVKIIILESAYEQLLKDPTNEVAKWIVDHLRSFIYVILNSDVIKHIFIEFRNIVKKNKNVMTKLEQVESLFPVYTEMFDTLRGQLLVKKKERSKTDIDKTIDKIEEAILKDVADSKTAVHVLFSAEPFGPIFKYTLKPSGLMRCFDQQWKFCSPEREIEYLHQIQDIEKLGIERGYADNPYDAYGTIDVLHGKKFRIVERKGKGFVCESVSNKPKLIKLILYLRQREKELAGETTLNPEISDFLKKMKKPQLIIAIQGNIHKGMEIFKEDLESKSGEELRILDTLMSVDVKKVLCPMVKEWFIEQGLLYEI